MSRFIDITGQRFARLVAVRVAEKRFRRYWWHCRCDCGATPVVDGNALRTGGTKSCGCLNRERTAQSGRLRRTHGATKTSEYMTWIKMKRRCTLPSEHAFESYGGRGITVCDRWLEAFENFIADMGLKPTPLHTLDRIDNNAGYSKDNCRWASRTQQARNTRANRTITALGQTRLRIEWQELTGIRAETICQRIKDGWSPDDAVSLPIWKRKITQDIANEIRLARASGLRRSEVARRFGVSVGLVKNVFSGRCWRAS